MKSWEGESQETSGQKRMFWREEMNTVEKSKGANVPVTGIKER